MDDARQDSKTKKDEAEENRRTENRNFVYELSKIMKMPEMPKINVLKETVWCLLAITEARQSTELDDDESKKRMDLLKDSRRRHGEIDSISEMKILMIMPPKATENETLKKVLEFVSQAEISTFIEFPKEYWTRHEFSERKILECDRRIEIVAGYTESEVSGRDAFDFIHPQDVSHVKIDLRRMSLKRSGCTIYRLKTKGGEYIILMSKGHVVDKPNPKGTVKTFLCYNRLLSYEEGLLEIEKIQQKYSICYEKVQNDDEMIDKIVQDPNIWNEFHQTMSDGTQPAQSNEPSTSSVATDLQLSSDTDDVNL